MELEQLQHHEPLVFDEKIRELVREAALDLGLKTCDLPSGAGHDAGVFANAGIPSAMIFVRNENGSHNPLEAMDLNDFMDALDVLHTALLNPVL